jgi:hypothetical protein
MKLPLDISSRIELNYENPSIKVRHLKNVDAEAIKGSCQAIIINPVFLDSFNMLRMNRNSKYKIIVSIDRDCTKFGANKIHTIRENLEADGYEIGLTKDKNENEIFNEITSINNIIESSGLNYSVRWFIDLKNGQDYLDNCLRAISRAKSKGIKYDLVTISTDTNDSELILNLIKSSREKLGMAKASIKMKLNKYNESHIVEDTNVKYEFNIEEIM